MRVEIGTKPYTASDLDEFDSIIRRCDSRRQTERIAGRTEWWKFEKRFPKTILDLMWTEIKERRP